MSKKKKSDIERLYELATQNKPYENYIIDTGEYSTKIKINKRRITRRIDFSSREMEG